MKNRNIEETVNIKYCSGSWK